MQGEQLEAKGPRPKGKVAQATQNDIMMWLGYQSYPSVAAFVRETLKIGISKRVSHLPSRLDPGETRLYLAHDYGIRGEGVVIGMCVIGRVEVVGPLTDDVPEWVVSVEPDLTMRGGQWRDEGMYLMADKLEVFDHPRKWPYKRFRSFRWVSREAMDKLPRMDTVDPEPESDSIYRTGWSAEERGGLLRRAQVVGPYQACKEHARETGRSFEACMYQWRKHRIK